MCGGRQRQLRQDKQDGTKPGEDLESQARKSVVHCEHIRYVLKFSQHRNDEINLVEVGEKII